MTFLSTLWNYIPKDYQPLVGKSLLILLGLYIAFNIVSFVFNRLFPRWLRGFLKFVLWTIPKWILTGLLSVFRKVFSFIKFKKSGLSYSSPEDLLAQVDKIGNGDTYLKGKLFEEFIRDCFRRCELESYTTGDLRDMGKLPEGIQGTAGSGEQGVDVVVWIPMKKRKLKVVIQCKHYSNTIGNDSVKEIVAAMRPYDGDIGVVISNQDYTPQAIYLAEKNHIILIGRKELPNFVLEPNKLLLAA